MTNDIRNHGHVLVGIWMSSPDEANILLKAIEGRLRNIAPNDVDRPQLEKWRREVLNFPNRATNGGWVGWSEGESP